MLKTKRNGDAIAIYCAAMGCETVYADVFPDRVLVYSFHYGRTHSTPIHAGLFAEMSVLVCEGEPASLKCVCDQQYCATVGAGQVVVESKHRAGSGSNAGEVHQNVWGIEEIAMICNCLGLITAIIPEVEIDLDEVQRAS